MAEEEEIVIVGGGICGLATALALHRKGIRSVVLERSKELRSSGAAIGIHANGWRALHQLGIASMLKQTAFPLEGARDIWLDKGLDKQAQFGIGEARCLRRSDLINALADALPPGSIHFQCQIVSVRMDPLSSYPILQLLDGRSIAAKILIGCDGSKSVVAEFLNLSPVKDFGLIAARGLTNYSNGHPFSREFLRIRKTNIFVGAIPIDDKAMYWFVSQRSSTYKGVDSVAFPDPEAIRNSTLESVNGFPTEIMQMIEWSDLDTISLTRVRYRAPWALLLGKFRKGTTTVAGDAMHVMGPFLGQGGSAGLEDAIVLARCLSKKLDKVGINEKSIGKKMMAQRVGEAMDEYLAERRMRVVRLSMQTYLTGSLFLPSTPVLVRFSCSVLIAILFKHPNNHTRFDCGIL